MTEHSIWLHALGGGRFSIQCGRCERSATVVAPTHWKAWKQLAADGWTQTEGKGANGLSCPQCAHDHE